MAAKKNKEINLLVVEDDPGLQKQLQWTLADFNPVIVGDRESALEQIEIIKPAVVTLDLGLPPDPANATEGLATLDAILKIAPYTKIIVVTGNEERDNALAAIEKGAYDFYQKPIDQDVLTLIIQRAFKLHALEQENRELQEQQHTSPMEGIVGTSSEMMSVCRMIEKVAPSDATVLILGESGTGKEVLSRALHRLSDREEGPFVAINCAAIPENLLESELFGYEKGAFTGANKQTKGKIEYANKGTLLLDEIGDIPMPLQAKLLRFLQERVIERLGGREEIPVDLRIVCATHKDIQELIQQGGFREDLYYRIAEITVTIPPLRERGLDVVLIARSILKKHQQNKPKEKYSFSIAAERAIEAYHWTGNVRELENKVRRSIIMADGMVIEADDLELDESTEELSDTKLTLKDVRDRAEEDTVRKAMVECHGNIGQVAEILDVSRPTIYHLMKKFDISS